MQLLPTKTSFLFSFLFTSWSSLFSVVSAWCCFVVNLVIRYCLLFVGVVVVFSLLFFCILFFHFGVWSLLGGFNFRRVRFSLRVWLLGGCCLLSVVGFVSGCVGFVCGRAFGRGWFSLQVVLCSIGFVGVGVGVIVFSRFGWLLGSCCLLLYFPSCAAYAVGCAAYPVGCAAYAAGCAAYVRQCENKANSVQLSWSWD